MITHPHFICSGFVAYNLTQSPEGTEIIASSVEDYPLFLVGTYRRLPVYVDSTISFKDERLFLVTNKDTTVVEHGVNLNH